MPKRARQHADTEGAPPPEWRKGDVVFAKVKSHPWWPARVEERAGNKVGVHFFDNDDEEKRTTAEVEPENVEPFDESSEHAKKKQPALKKGIARARAWNKMHEARAGLGDSSDDEPRLSDGGERTSESGDGSSEDDDSDDEEVAGAAGAAADEAPARSPEAAAWGRLAVFQQAPQTADSAARNFDAEASLASLGGWNARPEPVKVEAAAVDLNAPQVTDEPVVKVEPSFKIEPEKSERSEAGWVGGRTERAAEDSTAAAQVASPSSPAAASGACAAPPTILAHALLPPEVQNEELVATLLASPAALEHYAAALKNHGYIFVTDLLEADEGEIQTLIKNLDLKKPEVRRFRKAISTRRVGGTGAAAASSRELSEKITPEAASAEQQRRIAAEEEVAAVTKAREAAAKAKAEAEVAKAKAKQNAERLAAEVAQVKARERHQIERGWQNDRPSDDTGRDHREASPAAPPRPRDAPPPDMAHKIGDLIEECERFGMMNGDGFKRRILRLIDRATFTDSVLTHLRDPKKRQQIVNIPAYVAGAVKEAEKSQKSRTELMQREHFRENTSTRQEQPRQPTSRKRSRSRDRDRSRDASRQSRSRSRSLPRSRPLRGHWSRSRSRQSTGDSNTREQQTSSPGPSAIVQQLRDEQAAKERQKDVEEAAALAKAAKAAEEIKVAEGIEAARQEQLAEQMQKKREEIESKKKLALEARKSETLKKLTLQVRTAEGASAASASRFSPAAKAPTEPGDVLDEILGSSQAESTTTYQSDPTVHVNLLMRLYKDEQSRRGDTPDHKKLRRRLFSLSDEACEGLTVSLISQLQQGNLSWINDLSAYIKNAVDKRGDTGGWPRVRVVVEDENDAEDDVEVDVENKVVRFLRAHGQQIVSDVVKHVGLGRLLPKPKAWFAERHGKFVMDDSDGNGRLLVSLSGTAEPSVTVRHAPPSGVMTKEWQEGRVARVDLPGGFAFITPSGGGTRSDDVYVNLWESVAGFWHLQEDNFVQFRLKASGHARFEFEVAALKKGRPA